MNPTKKNVFFLAMLGICLLLLDLPCKGMGGMSGGGMGGGGCCGGGGGGSSVIDPPVGGAFRDAVTMPDKDPMEDMVEVDVEAKVAPIKVNGVTANLMTYNGLFPGPNIRVKRGDMLKVHMKNSLPATTAVNMLGYPKNHTNLHTHGLHVPAEPPMDGMPPGDFVMYSLLPGETFEHEYPLALQAPGTLNFFHGHEHGLTAEQFWAGMVGTIRVEDPTPLLNPFEEHIMVLKDISLSGNAPAPHSTMSDYMMGKEGGTIMINGVVNPRLSIKAGQVQRWRILNASNARFYKLSLENHVLNVIGTDGGLLDKPVPLSNILISPGERLDVLVKGTASSGSFRLLSLPYSRMGMMSSPQITMLTLTYSGTQTPAQSVPAAIKGAAVRLNPNNLTIAARRTLVLSMGQGNAYINGQDFDVNPFEVMSKVGTYEIWTIQNSSNMDHPFHQHINEGQVLSISGGDANYYTLMTKSPAWKDVVIVPKMGSATILIPIMDYTAHAMFHCHILEHEDIGMMGMWHIMGMDDMGGM